MKSHSDVVLTLEGSQTVDKIAPLPVIFSFEGTKLKMYNSLAFGEVNIVGGPVVAIVQERGIAEDARDEVGVECEPLHSTLDAVEALTPASERDLSMIKQFSLAMLKLRSRRILEHMSLQKC